MFDQSGVYQSHIYFGASVASVQQSHLVIYACLYCAHLTFTCACNDRIFIVCTCNSCTTCILCASVTHVLLAHHSPLLCSRYQSCVFVLRPLNIYTRLFMVAFLVFTYEGCTILCAWITHLLLAHQSPLLCSRYWLCLFCFSLTFTYIVYGRIFSVHMWLHICWVHETFIINTSVALALWSLLVRCLCIAYLTLTCVRL